MGIKEYFEKYPEKDLKLQNLDLEFGDDEKKELKFDPETEISDSDWQKMKQKLENDRKNDDWWNFARQAMPMKILCPEKSAELQINDQAWQGMKQGLEYFRNNNNWWYFVEQAICMKILCPDKLAELQIDDQAWQGMKQRLKKFMNDWHGFAWQAMPMVVLAADKVEISDQGLEITLREEKFKAKPQKPRPERRKF